VLSALAVTALAVHAAPLEQGQLDANPTLFTVLAAMNACGYDAGLNSPDGHPIRRAIREEIAKRQVPSLPALKEFFDKHRKRDDTAELSQYISFALTAGPPPAFAVKGRDVDIPPDAAALAELSPLLETFYKEANIEDLWNWSQRAIDQYLERYHKGVSEAVLQVNAYLRQQTSGFRGRRFQIFIELQAAPNQIQTRNYGDTYTVVVTPSAEPRIFDIRHGYLFYLLDPLALRYREILERKRGLIDHAQRAEALPGIYKEDFGLLTTASLVKAVEARLDRNDAAVPQALREGYILAPYFAEQLPVYEKQEAAMLVYYPDLIKPIDLVREDARLSRVDFNAAPAPRIVRPAAPEPAPELSGAAKTLHDADEQAYNAHNLDAAKALYLKVLEQTDQKPLHAAAYYGMARIAAQQRDPETAERLFQKSLELEPAPQVKSWALVYLGRLSLAAGERDQAYKRFQEALQVPGAPDEARQAAQQGLQPK
jgi:tetratricopeptide (TPR) repeat protein